MWSEPSIHASNILLTYFGCCEVLKFSWKRVQMLLLYWFGLHSGLSSPLLYLLFHPLSQTPARSTSSHVAGNSYVSK